MQYNFLKNNRGFTLVESLVAIMIILTAITGAFAVAQSGLQASHTAKERVIAYFLAQETIEMVKNARDHNNLERYRNQSTIEGDPQSPAWLYGMTNSGAPCAGSASCDWSMDLVDPDEHDVYLGTFVSCPSGGCELLRDSDGLYSYADGGTPSGFWRELKITELISGVEAEVSVTVSWGVGKSVVIKENIYNWSVSAS